MRSSPPPVHQPRAARATAAPPMCRCSRALCAALRIALRRPMQPNARRACAARVSPRRTSGLVPPSKLRRSPVFPASQHLTCAMCVSSMLGRLPRRSENPKDARPSSLQGDQRDEHCSGRGRMVHGIVPGRAGLGPPHLTSPPLMLGIVAVSPNSRPSFAGRDGDSTLWMNCIWLRRRR